MTFQASDLKGRHFLDLVDSDNNILELSYSKAVHSSNTLAIPTLYMQELQEQSPTMLQSVNIDFISFLEKSLVVLVDFTLLRQDNISFMSVGDLTSIRTQEEIQ